MKRICVVIYLILTCFNQLFAPNLNEYDQEQKNTNKERIVRLDELMAAEFSVNNLKELLILLNVDHVEIIIEQMKLETGRFTSPLFLNHNNLTGMHFAVVRDSYAYEFTIADNGRKCSSYRSWQSSVLDLLLRIEYYENLGYSLNNYYSFLENTGYCEKDGYADLLRSMVENT